MKLYHCKGARSLRPLWTLEEMGLDYELETMPFPPRFLREGYTGINPVGTVPYFVDGETEMTESAGIAQYLVEVYGPTDLALKPGDKEYGAWLNWIHRSDATLTFPQTIVLRYTQLEPEERRLKQAAEDYTQWFFARLRTVEAALDGRDYLCADRFTVADICVGFSLYLADTLGFKGGFKPNTAAYYERLSARPAFQRSIEL
ncbi:glutathione S-transferase family protein [Parvibaculum sp.]|uniref:glutathione S-transferase family protein n=1 Tax=Parvibaculum sp. TaxID=2024848 RepID=UPI000C8FF36A|nr:glutathione S-transferase family protein [Parvibaculum sp.]MAB12980.1 glutathione S-transferase [Parvibaculum sp.]|tara:strand:- start:2 stop:607 length:606 start_codon:yes stop_codon:yes gene_type:complete